MPKLKYSEDDKERALKLYKAGMSGPEVEGVTGVKKGTVQKWARQEGIVRDRSSIELTEKEKKEIIYLYRKGQSSTNQISAMMDIPKHQVFYFLRKKGLTRSRNQARQIRAERQIVRRERSKR